MFLPSARAASSSSRTARRTRPHGVFWVSRRAIGDHDHDDFSKCFDDTWNDVSNTILGWLQDLGWSDPEALMPLLLVVIVAVIVVTIALWLTQNSPWGRVLRAIREDEDAAQALGKNTLAYKLQSLAIAAALGAIAGFFLALDLATVHPTRLRAAGDLLRLQRADPRRARRATRGVAVGAVLFWFVLEGTRFIDLPDPPFTETPHRGAPVRDHRPAADRADGLPPPGPVRQAEEMVLGE